MLLVRIVIQLSRRGTVFLGSECDLDSLRIEFDRRHCLRLPELLEPSLLRLIQDRIEGSKFVERVHDRVGVELCMIENNVLGLLHFLTDNPVFFRFIEAISGCTTIRCFSGRVYCMRPGGNHYDSWHDDRAEHRVIGMSINLSTGVYAGGIFRLRDSRSSKTLCELPNTGFGDAIVFRIGSHLQHRITQVEGTVPKTAFAGWFRSHMDHNSALGLRRW